MASFLARTFSRRRPIEISEIPELQDKLRRSLEQIRVNNTRYLRIETDNLEEFIMKLFHSNNSSYEPVQNKDYALAYIRELKPHIPENAITRMTAKANELDNTNNPEPQMVKYISSLRNINKQYLPADQRNRFPIDTLSYMESYPRYLLNLNIDDNRVPILVHNVTIFLISLLENNTARNIDRELAQEFLNLFEIYFINTAPLDFVFTIQRVINELSNSRYRPLYLVNAIEMHQQAIHENYNNNRLAQMLEENIHNMYPILSAKIDQWDLSLLYNVMNDMRLFVDFIIANRPIQSSLGIQYINNIKEFISQPIYDQFIEYIFTQQNEPTNTNQQMNEINRRILRFLSIIRNQRTPLQSISSIPKTPIRSSTIENDTPISTSCDTYLTNFNPYFKRLETKLKKICTLYTKSCDDLDKRTTNLKDAITLYKSSSYKILNVNSYYTLAAAFKFWNTLDNRNQIQFGISRMDNFTIKYREGKGEGIGVVRDFFKNCIDELVRYNIFGYIGSESIQRYQINPLFNPDDTFKKESGVKFEKEEDFVLFYKFIGRLLCFILLNDIGLNFHLSHAILAHMIYKHEDITDDEYTGYFMLDYPEYFNSYVNMMKMDPDEIEGLEIEFNDDYELINDNKFVTKTNFREYMILRSKHKLLHQINSRDDKDTYNRFKGLASGFNPLQKLLAKEKFTVSALDKLITFETIDDNTIQMLIEKFKSNMSTRIQNTTNDKDRSEKKVATDLMVSIMEDDGRTFPYEVVNMEPPSDEETRKNNFYNFIEHLLSFWSGYRHYSNSLNYSIVVKSNNTTDDTLPISHTCFTEIDIPVNYHDNRDKLYQKLVQAVYLGEKGIGNYGGGYKKTQYKFLERSSKKAKTIYKNKTNFYIQDKKTYKKLFSKKGGNPVKYVAVFCANSDKIRDKTMILMKSVMPDHDIIYTPMGTIGDQRCKVDVLSSSAVYNFLSDVECSNLPMYAKFDAIIFENCPIMGTFQTQFFNDNTIRLWKNITHEQAPFYLGFFTDANLEGVDFTNHAISKHMKQTNHYRIIDDQKDLNVFEYKLN